MSIDGHFENPSALAKQTSPAFDMPHSNAGFFAATAGIRASDISAFGHVTLTNNLNSVPGMKPIDSPARPEAAIKLAQVTMQNGTYVWNTPDFQMRWEPGGKARIYWIGPRLLPAPGK